jgi:hypothetical protein
MGPLIALLPQLLGMLQKRKQEQQPSQGPGYNQTPPAPEDPEEAANRRAQVMGKLKMPPMGEKLGDNSNDAEPDMDQDDMWNKMGGGGGGY